MLSSDKLMVQLVVDQCEIHGIRKIVFSPGSRNAPLAISFDENPAFETHIIHDERSAAFFALGMAQELGEPVALCCTSGTASLNYYPAIAEAFYRSVPLLVITADRPESWINQGDGQTIVQKDVYKSHIRYAVNLTDGKQTETDFWYAQRETAIAFNILNSSWKGPVHINIGLNEPLYETVEKTNFYGRKLNTNQLSTCLSSSFKSEIASNLESSKILVLCGQLPKNRALEIALEKFSNNSNVVVLVENTSNLQSDKFINCIDRTLNGIGENESEFYPDVLITIGGAVVSKKIKAFLRKAKPKQHWKIGFDFPFMDTYQCLTDSIEIADEQFFSELNEIDFQRNKLNYFGKWKSIDLLAKDRIEGCIATFEKLTDISVFYHLFDWLPEHSILHIANSSVVRYTQLFDIIKNVRYESNRGTSGIDGSTSTAVGAAIANPNQMHYFVTGDISFLYDSNAFWNSKFPKNLKIIVINNFGGGIFRIISGPAESKQREKYFEASQHQSTSPIATAFGIESLTVKTTLDFLNLLPEFLKPENEIQLLEVFTDTEQNPKDLTHFFNYIKTK
ncbi:MAG: 2-succinyl-5-enolpyruvyl-6-hydroxy-3-cyclohexene-1-carboxylic-acid synthase [Crocinitomicaceae bacterium]|nr:2-succinyl-5-enolpyruvyl-6-hydroxy-3-cyclohexene-1-carboxylic-acid synthase [Crocinitomicaceae bacterium]